MTTQDPENLPIVIERGEGIRVYDVDGNVFYDFASGVGVINVGHSHPRVVEAIKKQAEKFTHYSLTDFFYENAIILAEKLIELAPPVTSRGRSSTATAVPRPTKLP